MSNNKKFYQIEHPPMGVDTRPTVTYKGHLEGQLHNSPLILASSETAATPFGHDIPTFPIKEPMRGKLLEEHIRSLKLTSHQKDVLTASFLGKIATFSSKKDNRVRFDVSLKQKDYLLHLYTLFDKWAIAAPVLDEKSYKEKRRRGRRKRAGVKINQIRYKKGKVSMYFEIYDHPSLSYYRDQFFMETAFLKTNRKPTSKPKIVKRVPSEINSMLTSRAAAYLFLDRGFFDPKSVDNTKYWASYSFRLKHLHYYGQLIKIFSDKFGIDLTREYDNSHEVYSYNQQNRYTQLLYVVGESREKLVNLLVSSLPDEFHSVLYASDEYKQVVEQRQAETRGLDYDYWFPASDPKGRLGKFDTNKEPLDTVKGIITSTNKRERWLANGHKELPSEMFGLGLDVNEKGLPPHVFPKKYVKQISQDNVICSKVSNAISPSLRDAINNDINSTWQLDSRVHFDPKGGPFQSYSPRYTSNININEVVDMHYTKKPVNVKTSFLKSKVQDLLSNTETEENKDN